MAGGIGRRVPARLSVSVHIDIGPRHRLVVGTHHLPRQFETGHLENRGTKSEMVGLGLPGLRLHRGRAIASGGEGRAVMTFRGQVMELDHSLVISPGRRLAKAGGRISRPNHQTSRGVGNRIPLRILCLDRKGQGGLQPQIQIAGRLLKVIGCRQMAFCVVYKNKWILPAAKIVPLPGHRILPVILARDFRVHAKSRQDRQARPGHGRTSRIQHPARGRHNPRLRAATLAVDGEPDDDIGIAAAGLEIAVHEIAGASLAVGEQAHRPFAHCLEGKAALGIGRGLAGRLSFSLHIDVGSRQRLPVRTQHLAGQFLVGLRKHNHREREKVGWPAGRADLLRGRTVPRGIDTQSVALGREHAAHLHPPAGIGSKRFHPSKTVASACHRHIPHRIRHRIAAGILNRRRKRQSRLQHQVQVGGRLFHRVSCHQVPLRTPRHQPVRLGLAVHIETKTKRLPFYLVSAARVRFHLAVVAKAWGDGHLGSRHRRAAGIAHRSRDFQGLA